MESCLPWRSLWCLRCLLRGPTEGCLGWTLMLVQPLQASVQMDVSQLIGKFGTCCIHVGIYIGIYLCICVCIYLCICMHLWYSCIVCKHVYIHTMLAVTGSVRMEGSQLIGIRYLFQFRILYSCRYMNSWMYIKYTKFMCIFIYILVNIDSSLCVYFPSYNRAREEAQNYQDTYGHKFVHLSID